MTCRCGDGMSGRLVYLRECNDCDIEQRLHMDRGELDDARHMCTQLLKYDLLVETATMLLAGKWHIMLFFCSACVFLTILTLILSLLLSRSPPLLFFLSLVGSVALYPHAHTYICTHGIELITFNYPLC